MSDELPRISLTRARLLGLAVVAASVVLCLLLVGPKVIGLRHAWERIDGGDPAWLGLAAGLEVLSFASYIALFRGVFGRAQRSAPAAAPIRWRESYQITMASLAAARVVAAAGAGGIALTAWALRRAGLGRRSVAARMLAFFVLLYGVYMAAFVIDGAGLGLGLLPGPAPLAITLAPAIFGAAVIALCLALTYLPSDLEALAGGRTCAGHRVGRGVRWLAAVSATAAGGVRIAIDLFRARELWLLGAVGWWGFDIAVLWACFHAFGSPPTVTVIVMAYFVGMLGTTLPLPGGIGGVEGGMIGAFTAFGVHLEFSVLVVLAYRVFSFWIPTLPGAVAYLQLRRTMQQWRTAPVEPSLGRAPVPSYT